MRRVGFIGAAMLASLLVVTSCTSSNTSTTTSSPASGPQSSGTPAAGPSLYGQLPPVGAKAKPGGTVSVGQLYGATPTYILPIMPLANQNAANVYQLQGLLFNPLLTMVKGNTFQYNPQLSIGNDPQYSNGNKTVTISMKKTYKWSDGKPVDAQDVVFYFALNHAAEKQPAYGYTPGEFPSNVASAKAIDQYTVQLQLTKAYNPRYFTTIPLQNVVPLPSTTWNRASTGGPPLDFTVPANATKILNYLAAQAKDVSTYASNPLWKTVSGPMTLTSFTAATGAYTMAPNPSYGGEHKAQISELDFKTFTSTTALFNQLEAGTLTMGPVDFSVLPQVSRIKDKYNVFGYPISGYNYMLPNFKNTTGHWNKVIAQLYIRQVFAHLTDQPGMVRGLLGGAGAPTYSTIPVGNPYAPDNAKTAPYPYSPDTAAALLTSHGWTVVPNGTTTCAKPGTGADQCGEGIPAGTAISPTLMYANQPPLIGQEVQAFASTAKKVGINMTLNGKEYNSIFSTYWVPGAPANNNNWSMIAFGGIPTLPYPTTNQIFTTDGPGNGGGYSDPKADALIHDSVYGSDPKAVTQEAAYLTMQLPVLFLPNQDQIFAVSKTLSATDTDSFTALVSQPVPQNWYFTQ